MSEAIFNFHDAVLLSIIFQSLSFIVLILFAKRDRHKSDYFLSAFFLAQAMVPIHILITYGNEVHNVAIAISPNYRQSARSTLRLLHSADSKIARLLCNLILHVELCVKQAVFLFTWGLLNNIVLKTLYISVESTIRLLRW